MKVNLDGKVALVTGGARGVGRAISLSLAAEGAKVVVNYHGSGDAAKTVVQEIEDLGGNALMVQCDVSNLAEVRSMVESTVRAFGRLDVLVNSAGLVIRQRFKESNPEDWTKQINVDLYGTINCVYCALPYLEEHQGAGRVITLIGDSSRVGESGLAVAAAARAGAIALSKSIARETRSGLTANTVALGLIETDHEREFIEAARDKLIKLYPLRRLGRTEDVTPLITLLASDAGSWITGQIISVNGGFSMV